MKTVVVVGDRKPESAHLFSELVERYPATDPSPIAFDFDQDLVALPYSSGTTGLPKGVMLSQRNLVCNNIQFISASHLTERDTLLIFLPFYHIYGTMLMGGAISAGATQVIMERFDLVGSLELVVQHRVTRYYAVPPILLALSNFPELKKFDLSSVRYILCGVAPLPPEVAARVGELTGVPVLQGYGLTEAAPLTHVNPGIPGLQKLASVGVRVSDQEEKIVDLETGEKELSVGEVGEVVVRGPHVMKGYWKNPEATHQAIRHGWLYTGDIGKFDEDGYLYLVDRKKEMIKYKGFSIAPAEVEAVLFLHPAVADCAVVGKPDPEAGQVPKAFIVLKKDYAGVQEQEFLDFCEGKLAGFKRVREVEFVASIPKTASGKILRRVLVEQEAAKRA